jgi:hypothetical protein
MLAIRDKASIEEQDRVLEQAWELALRTGDAETRGFLLLLRGVTNYTRMDFDTGLKFVREGRAWVSSHCLESGWLEQELDSFISAQLCVRGDLVELDTMSRASLRRAYDTGSEFHIEVTRCHRGFVSLAKGDFAGVIAEVDDVLATWSPYQQLQMVMVAAWVKLCALLYRDDADAAWRHVQQYWPLAARHGYAKTQPWKAALPYLEGTAALACAQRWPARRRYVRSVERCLKLLEAQRLSWARSASSLLQAGLAHLRGQRVRAELLYRSAAEGFEAQTLPSFAMAARQRQSALLAGGPAEQLRARTRSWYDANGIVDPERWTSIYAPIRD